MGTFDLKSSNESSICNREVSVLGKFDLKLPNLSISNMEVSVLDIIF